MHEQIHTLLSWYQEPLFWYFPIATALLSMAAFLLFALPLTWISHAEPAWASRYKIQSRHDRHVSSREALTVWFKNNVQAFIGVLLLWPLLRLSGIHIGVWPAWWVIALQLGFIIYLDDFVFYWFHRAMHTRWLLKHIHGIHHRIFAPRAIAGHYMHPLEYALTAMIALIGPLLLGVHVITLYLWVVFRQWEAAEGHCGYDFPWSPTRWLPLSDGAVHHDFHHSKIKGNFAGFLSWTDRVFGTLVPDYDADKARAQTAKTGIRVER